MEPEQADRVVDVYRMALFPVMQDYDGFVSSFTYDSRAPMERSREKADALREDGAREAGVEMVEVCEFELALAHLRVPEMT
jgi:hypothetical protein